MGRNVNAIRLQILAAMIAYALLRIAARVHRVHRVSLDILRFTDLVAQCLFECRPLHAIEQPPNVNPGKKRQPVSPDPMSLRYA